MPEEFDDIHAELDRKASDLLGPIYDREGDLITFLQWAELKKDPDYLRVGLDTVNGHEISTSWLGIPAGEDWGYNRPLIFETFISGPRMHRVWARYPTEEHAIDGHRQAIFWLT